MDERVMRDIDNEERGKRAVAFKNNDY